MGFQRLLRAAGITIWRGRNKVSGKGKDMNVYDIEVLERLYFSSFYRTICVVADSPQEALDGMMSTYKELDEVKSITLHAKDAIVCSPKKIQSKGETNEITTKNS